VHLIDMEEALHGVRFATLGLSARSSAAEALPPQLLTGGKADGLGMFAWQNIAASVPVVDRPVQARPDPSQWWLPPDVADVRLNKTPAPLSRFPGHTVAEGSMPTVRARGLVRVEFSPYAGGLQPRESASGAQSALDLHLRVTKGKAHFMRHSVGGTSIPRRDVSARGRSRAGQAQQRRGVGQRRLTGWMGGGKCASRERIERAWSGASSMVFEDHFGARHEGEASRAGRRASEER